MTMGRGHGIASVGWEAPALASKSAFSLPGRPAFHYLNVAGNLEPFREKKFDIQFHFFQTLLIHIF